MHLIRNHQKPPQALQSAVVTIGNFDGMHKGHQQLLSELKMRAKELGCPCGVILFEPQPQEFFAKKALARLSTFRQKYQAIKQQGIDFIMVLGFNRHWAALEAGAFIEQVLWQQLHIQEIWVGQDFHFGHNRLGNFALLNQYGPQCGFQVRSLHDVTLDGQRISSTQIRALLAQDELLLARQLLGRYFTMEGKVISGDARGRDLNMPTANIQPKQKMVPIQGIFVVRVTLGHRQLPAVASLGTRPVFSGNTVLLEVHIFDFDENIYGKRISVEFLHKLRDEVHFASVDLLQTQMQQDLLDAKNYWDLHNDEL